jgi:hypothetical protein
VAEDNCRTEESVARDNMPTADDEFEGNKDDLIEFFFALAGSSLIKTTAVWQKTSTDEESIARHHKPIAEDEFQHDKDDS